MTVKASQNGDMLCIILYESMMNNIQDDMKCIQDDKNCMQDDLKCIQSCIQDDKSCIQKLHLQGFDAISALTSSTSVARCHSE